MRQYARANAAVRKQPDIFCLTLAFRKSRSPALCRYRHSAGNSLSRTTPHPMSNPEYRRKSRSRFTRLREEVVSEGLILAAGPARDQSSVVGQQACIER